MVHIIRRRPNPVSAQIILLAIIYATSDANQLPVDLSDFSGPEMEKCTNPVYADRFSDECQPYTENNACTTTQKVDSLSCDFNSLMYTDDTDYFTRLLPKCDSGEKSAGWTNMPYFSYQFSRDDQNIQEGEAAVVSNCLKNTFPSSLISPTQATATLRTGIYPGAEKCEQFHLSYWCKFEVTPNVTGEDDPNRFFLELALHRQGRNCTVIDGAGLPSRILWGSKTDDYSSVQSNQWHQVVLTFHEFEQFSLMFFAHHNDLCDKANLKLIHLDLVVVEREPTSTPDTTATPDTTTTLDTITTATTTVILDITTVPDTTTILDTITTTTMVQDTTTVSSISPDIILTPDTTIILETTATSDTIATFSTTTAKQPNAIVCQHPSYASGGKPESCRCPLTHVQTAINTSTTVCQAYPAIVKVSIKMETLFDESLRDPTSQNFKQLSKILSIWARKTYQPILGMLEARAGEFHPFVLSFWNGSIVANTLFRFLESNSLSIKTIRSAIINANSSLIGPITLNGKQVTTTVLATDLPFNACEENDQATCFPQDTTECVFNNETEKSWCHCLPGSVRITPYTCKYDPCGASPCGENANCLVNAAANSKQRVCECLNGFSRASDLPEEADCKKSISVSFILIIVLCVVAGLILILVIAVFCILVRRRMSRLGKSKTQDSYGIVTRNKVISRRNLHHKSRLSPQPWKENITIETLPEPNRDYRSVELSDSDIPSRPRTSYESRVAVNNIYDELRSYTESVVSEPNSLGRNSEMSTFGYPSRLQDRPVQRSFTPRPDYSLKF